MGLVKMILNLSLSFLHIVGAYKIYTEIFPFEMRTILPLIWFDLVHLPLSFLYFLIRRRHIYINMLMPGIYNYWWHITYFEYHLGKKETRIFYVSRIITSIIFSELLRKSTLLIRYKLNSSRPPQVNHFDIHVL